MTERMPRGERFHPTLYGRRKGKKLRSHHSLLVDEFLPQVTVVPSALAQKPLSAFARPLDDLWLEIGFGGGEHLAHDAKSRREIGFIGCEPFINGVAKLLALIEEDELDNVRVHSGDALEVLKALPEASLGRIAILYPDPWPKTHQKKRRFISDESVQELARALRPGCELHFATDIDDYSAWALARILRSGLFDWQASAASDWLTPWADWPGTRYEAKAIAAGRKPVYLTFVKR
ncbi:MULTISPECIES: tRNA (guanine(46)-N(7))-methyltransferase TrmB [unclassified Beijerinckia]|uniref:tRNA (guanine(46)-N(7))-methyltransferase TrmB n=1 Tax=unclassified Beijerinckia TaxID=2638183 RepID=UPI000894265F|nr:MULTISPECIES: tRNA (guanine(46)-N(7))-methyltransferase TrmB [unclassified Beijerinckia]MDH7797957.1 tRNA (guanine-N7-)-methyltransferase [Beijerinckia sp. GAS462]SED04092.1 tRNA (guanine-N7-)-methyltransferase [Beijerinckia sp. 28-YEA-48]